MRKLTIVVALATIFSLAVAVPALALGPVTNLGDGDNTYSELRRGICPTPDTPNGDEEVFGRGGNDRLNLNQCGDTQPEPNAADSDADTANGNSGNDFLRVDDGDIQDTATGGTGSNDTCRADRDLGSDNAEGDPPPAGGPDADISDTVHPSCERIIWNTGDFYNQT
jgi:hypothetical protein